MLVVVERVDGFSIATTKAADPPDAIVVSLSKSAAIAWEYCARTQVRAEVVRFHLIMQ